MGISVSGSENRETYDKRARDWVSNDSRIFTTNYQCALSSVEVIVNTECTGEEALMETARAAEVLGRLPIGPKANVLEIRIHDGWELAGVGNGATELCSDYVPSELDYRTPAEVKAEYYAGEGFVLATDPTENHRNKTRGDLALRHRVKTLLASTTTRDKYLTVALHHTFTTGSSIRSLETQIRISQGAIATIHY